MATDDETRTSEIRARLDQALDGISTPAPSYRGKVRDVYAKGDELFLVATDRVSAFDRVLGTIPLKGALLTEQSAFWLERANQITKTHFIERVDAQVMRVKRARALPVELVVRGYLAGSLLREKPSERGSAYGLQLADDLVPYQKFETPIITPTTKEDEGHDRPCSLDDLVHSGRATRAEIEACSEAALNLFREGSAFAEKNGLLLVDTKYEFGVIDGDVILIDEVHTADSSRYWVADSYPEKMAREQVPHMLDKERLRTWLLAQGFSGDGDAPPLPDDVRIDLAAHYWRLTETLLNQPFVPPAESPQTRVSALLRDAGLDA